MIYSDEIIIIFTIFYCNCKTYGKVTFSFLPALWRSLLIFEELFVKFIAVKNGNFKKIIDDRKKRTSHVTISGCYNNLFFKWDLSSSTLWNNGKIQEVYKSISKILEPFPKFIGDVFMLKLNLLSSHLQNTGLPMLLKNGN